MSNNADDNSTDGQVESYSKEHAQRAFPEETTGQVLERIYDKDPAKHSTPVDVRKERLVQGARADTRAVDAEANQDDLNIILAGGDPTEMLPGNKPRYTIDDEGLVRDHDETPSRVLNPKPHAPETPDAP